jgi:hypothetical protein
MKLKEIFISLTGCFKFSFDNSIFLANGMERSIYNDLEEEVAQVCTLDMMNNEKSRITSVVVAAFNQVGEKLLFLYKKEKFEVLFISDKLIRLTKNGIEYTIESIKLVD